MYLRWQARKRVNPKYWTGKRDEWIDDVHWAAIVVESVRVDGKPTQRHIAYLSGITESAIAIVHQRYYFWQDIDDRLTRLSNRIGNDDRCRIQEALAKKVPRPSEADAEQVRSDRAKWASIRR
jgi:hypothetical protein